MMNQRAPGVYFHEKTAHFEEAMKLSVTEVHIGRFIFRWVPTPHDTISKMATGVHLEC